jgi:hypothetical protein
LLRPHHKCLAPLSSISCRGPPAPRSRQRSPEPPLHRNTVVPSRPRRPVIVPPPRCVPAGPALLGAFPSSCVSCPIGFPAPHRPVGCRRPRQPAAAPRSSQLGRVATGPHQSGREAVTAGYRSRPPRPIGLRPRAVFGPALCAFPLNLFYLF